MYVNPFERMRKKREEEDKKRQEVEKEREKYARLGAQMGFADDKAVVPSFIKTLIGEKEQGKVPPFGMAMDSDFDSLPEPELNSQPMAQASNRTMEDFEKQFGGNDVGSSISSAPVFGSPMNNSQPSMAFEPQQAPMFDSPMNQPQMQFSSPQPQMPSFNENMAPQNNMNFEPQQAPMFDSPINQPQMQFNNNQAIVNEEELLIQKSFDEQIDDFFETEEVQLYNEKIITPDQYIDLLHNGEIEGKNVLIVDKSESIDKKQLANLIEIDLEKVMLYSSPCLFMLKRFINNLPEIISLDDKRVLWERTSLFLAATDWGKTGSEVDYILEELNLTADPVGMFVGEFVSLFESYNFNEQLNLVISGTQSLESNQLLFVNEFISNLLIQIPNVSCKTLVVQENIDVHEIEEILENYDYLVSDTIVLKEPEVKSKPQLNQQEVVANVQQFVEQPQPQMIYEQPQMSYQQEPIYQQAPQINSYQEPANFQENSWQQPVVENKKENSLDDFFTQELKDVSIDIFERPEENEVMLTYDKEDSNFTGNIPGISNSNFTDTYSSSQLPGFAKDHHEEEDYDPGIDSNLRIHVDQVLEAKKLEILEQEKREEQDRLERKGESGFDPSIISKKEVVLNPYANPFEGMNFQSPLSARNERLADPRPRNEIEGKLKDMNSNLAGRKPISIEESFANEKNKDKDKKLISVPGNWEKL
ncbi:hypothetical protein [Spiroplasma endosymbiont of Diplazon laetatorius]|uniref:hypothetical protein n=1 Tax=Spiroplasma endosymbiont of Diplazon laetatorius TaxID=3066322 RepID=UPI0030CE46CB